METIKHFTLLLLLVYIIYIRRCLLTSLTPLGRYQASNLMPFIMTVGIFITKNANKPELIFDFYPSYDLFTLHTRHKFLVLYVGK